MSRAGKLSMYSKGAKRCSACRIFLDWEGMHCPCCGTKLRNKPRCYKYKQRYLQQQGVVYH